MKFLLPLAMCVITIVSPSVARSAEEEVEALARGVVHEAYAEPTERQPAASPVIPKEPPKPIEELPPDQKPEGDNVQWIPGYWSYDEDRKDYVWVSGFWRVPPPARTWMAGSWQKTGEGWQWSGGFWAPIQEQKAELEYLPQPPKPLDEDGASIPAPSAEQVYVPGSWVYRTRYVWRPGYWTPYRANWIWMPAHYRWTPGGYVFIDGYWDYPLGSRGVLFSPCYIPPALYATPGYVYTPTYIVREPCLYGAFFCRRGYGSYYFGDYFAPSYASIGFTSWSGHVSATVRLGGYHDPLFSYYSIGYARDPYWGGGGLVNLYVGRYRGDFARPPLNYTQQNVVINNIKTTNITNVKNVTNYNNVQMLSTLKDAPKSTSVRLANVSETARREQQTNARDLRTVGVQRASQEVKLVSAGPMTGSSTPRSLKLDVPRNLQPTVSAPTIEAGRPGNTVPRADRTSTSATTPPGTGAKIDPKTTTVPGTMPKVDPRPVFPNPASKVDPKPVTPMPKVDPRPVTPMPKVDPRPVTPAPLPKVDVRPVNPVPVVIPKNPAPSGPLPIGPTPRVEPRPSPTPPGVGGPTTPRPAPATPRPAPTPPPAPKPKGKG